MSGLPMFCNDGAVVAAGCDPVSSAVAACGVTADAPVCATPGAVAAFGCDAVSSAVAACGVVIGAPAAATGDTAVWRAGAAATVCTAAGSAAPVLASGLAGALAGVETTVARAGVAALVGLDATSTGAAVGLDANTLGVAVGFTDDGEGLGLKITGTVGEPTGGRGGAATGCTCIGGRPVTGLGRITIGGPSGTCTNTGPGAATGRWTVAGGRDGELGRTTRWNGRIGFAGNVSDASSTCDGIMSAGSPARSGPDSRPLPPVASGANKPPGDIAARAACCSSFCASACCCCVKNGFDSELCAEW
ncbi:MAG: hypothetical protein JO152_00340 [Mycobacteriaceae bacterium]|nr:hypothetical protein [Mycobacteriaceae bacterium]